MTGNEVNPVIRVLHNHHPGEESRLFYMHVWVNDAAEMLAQGLKAALDETNST